jgi:hypothetical protein
MTNCAYSSSDSAYLLANEVTFYYLHVCSNNIQSSNLINLITNSWFICYAQGLTPNEGHNETQWELSSLLEYTLKTSL